MMPGVKFAEIAQALADSFNSFELEQMLRQGMSLRLDRIVGGGPFDQVIFNLVSWAERHGREGELLEAAHRVKPEKDRLRTVYQKSGLGPDVVLQKAGVPLLPGAPGPIAPTAGGPEKTVKTYIPNLDVELWRTSMAALENRVCRIEVGSSVEAIGTGFLVGPEAVLTNRHVLARVIDGPLPAGAVRFRFDAKRQRDSAEAEGVTVGLHKDPWLLDQSPMSAGELRFAPDDGQPGENELDYALVRLDRPIGNEPVGRQASASEGGTPRQWLPLPAADPIVALNMPVLILQYSSGGPLVLTLDTDRVIGLNANGTRVRYRTNTKNGSSGAPCFSIDWKLLALHHYGDPVYSLVGQWNQGVPIGLIRRRIERTPAAAGFLGGPLA